MKLGIYSLSLTILYTDTSSQITNLQLQQMKVSYNLLSVAFEPNKGAVYVLYTVYVSVFSVSVSLPLSINYLFILEAKKRYL